MASLTTREIVLLGILGVVGVITGFYHFYFTPQQNRLADLNNELFRVQQEYEDANLRVLQAEAMAGQIDEGLQDAFDEAMRGIGQYFNGPEAQRIIERIVYPHVAPGGNITFTFNEPTERDGMFVTETTLTFEATNRTALEAVARDLSERAPANRIVTFSVNATDDAFGIRGSLNVTMTIEFLTLYEAPPVVEPEEEEE